MPGCKECDIDYDYDRHFGVSRTHCSPFCDGITRGKEQSAHRIEALEEALSEAKKEQRHACAEAILACTEAVSGDCIWKDEAHAACMNA
jgi:hypothetical protein